MWWNDTKCKYMFMFTMKNLARKGLNRTQPPPILLVSGQFLRGQWCRIEMIARPQGISNTAARPQGNSNTAARPQGISNTAARPQGISNTAARPQGISNTAAKPQGISNTAARLQGISNTAARPQGISNTAASSGWISCTIVHTTRNIIVTTARPLKCFFFIFFSTSGHSSEAISTNIRTAGFCFKTAIILQWKCMCVPDCAST